MIAIPAIDVMGGRVVRLYRGDPQKSTVYGRDPAAMASRWRDEGAQMLHIVDLDAALGTGGNAGAIKKAARAVDIPVQVAGGLRSPADVSRVLEFAERAVVGTMAFEDSGALEEAGDACGRSRVVVSADHSDGLVVTHGWQRGTGTQVSGAVADLARRGFADILLTHVGRDGTMGGPDLEHLERACAVRGARIIASGGISGPGDVDRVRESGAHAVVLGRALYEGRVTAGGGAVC